MIFSSDRKRPFVRFAALVLSFAISAIIVPPVKTRDNDNPRAPDPRVTIDILSKQVRLLQNGILKDISVTIDDSTAISETFNNERIRARTLVFIHDGGIRLMADSREVARPARFVLDTDSEQATCMVRLGGEVRRYPLPMIISYEKNKLEFRVTEKLGRYTCDSAYAEYGAEYLKYREAVMALAHVIAARYRFKQKSLEHDDADFCDLTHCQVYRGRTSGDEALEEGWMIDPTELPVNLFFHSRCGGNTLDESVFSNHASMRGTVRRGVRDYLFLDGTLLCRSADSIWVRSMTREDLLKLIMPDTVHRSDEPFSIHYDRKQLVLWVSAGNSTMSFPPETFRLIINRVRGWNYIKSNNYTITERTVDEKEMVVFKGEGLGHCVGFCQHGAIALSRRGYSRYEILEHYFPGLSFTSSRDEAAGTPYLSYCVFDLSSGSVRAISPGLDFIQRKVPAGSVFKLIVALYLAAERPDIINEYTYTCTGKNTRDTKMPERCWNQQGHGVLQLKDAIPYSCNLYFASLYNRISISNFRIFFNAFCRCAGLHAALPEISSDSEWSLLLAGLDFRLTFTIGDYIKLVSLLDCGGSSGIGQGGCGAEVPYDLRLVIYKALGDTCRKGTAGGVMKPYGAGCNYQALPEYVKKEAWSTNQDAWGKTATVIDGTNMPVSYGIFIGGSGSTGIVVVLRKGNGHMAARWARAVISPYTMQ